MRHLSVKQKKLLDNWLKENSHLPGLAVCDAVCDYIPNNLYTKLVELNDMEILYQCVNNYINENAGKYNAKANPHMSNELGL